MLNIFNKNKENFEVIENVVKQIGTNMYVWSPNDLKGVTAYEDLLALKPEVLKPIILKLVKYIEEDGSNNYNYKKTRIGLTILAGLTRRNQHYNEEEWIDLFSQISASITLINDSGKNANISYSEFPMNYIIQQIERYVKKNGISDTLRKFISQVLRSDFSSTKKNYWGTDISKSVTKLQNLIKDENALVFFNLNTEDIGEYVNKIIEQSTIYDKKELHNVLYLASSVNGGQPTKKFTKEIETCIKILGKDKYRKVAQDILGFIAERPVKIIEKVHNYRNGETYTYNEQDYLNDSSKQFVKGIVWTVESFSDKTTIQYLEKILHKSYTKVPGVGPVAMAVGNACAYTLGNMRGKDGLGALSRAKLKLKQNNIKKTIDKYLLEGAKKYNVSVEELKEMAVPDFNLSNGQKTITFSDYSLIVSIEGSKVIQQWVKPDGSVMKSVPSIVKNDTKLTEKLKEVRKEVKEIQKVYSAQKQRIDNQFILNRTWDFKSFDKFYLSHGLVSKIAENLIWIIEKGNQKASVIFFNNTWEDEQGKEVTWIDDACTVRLWHPVFANEQEITSWRDHIIKLECKQPIKQSFRELYILTDAEINTVNYSNRMAAHILKQHQFKTLAVIRDWHYSLMGAYDDGVENQTCEKYLQEYEITAEYWIDEIADDDSFNDAGIWLYVATDQVKFKNKDGNVMNMIDVPKIVFSEIMRDVDLFVGVSSVGNDPEWEDNNGDRQNNYWRSYSFGDLTEIAKTRKAILERLLPRLTKINKKSYIDGKFLIVKGDIRTYKIHIGSGNILMEPNDQYLCIVPARNPEKSTDKLFIPFEGDKGLSIVLSKAFLLSEDNKITDSTIVSQINR